MRFAPLRSPLLCVLAAALVLPSCIESRRRKPGERAAKTETAAKPTAGALVLDPAAVDGKHDALVEGERFQALYDEDDPAEGSSKPLVTIVEYSDFECPFCGKLASSMS